jgi:sulfotransferase family protein
VVGAPKTGTSSLYEYLKQHPLLFMSRKKEPGFFCNYKRDFRGPGSHTFNKNLVTDPSEYLNLFVDASREALTGEASTDYLSCPQAPLRLQEWNPTAKIIACLRNPIDRAYSEHRHLVRDKLEQEEFATALRLETERRNQGWIPLFWHVERGLYYEPIKRYIRAFGEGNVKIVFHEDLTRSPRLVVRTLFEFLGVKPIPVEVTNIYNVSGYPVSRPLQSVLREETRLKTSLNALLRENTKTRIKESWLWDKLQKKTMSQPEFEYLRSQFTGDVARLQDLLRTDLSHWVENRY